MLYVNAKLSIPLSQIELTAVRAGGPGGQNVNKVSSAIHLRFDVGASTMPDRVKAKLLALSDQRLTKDGVLVIKANEHRTQAANKSAALRRLAALIDEALYVKKYRVPTRPSRNAVKRRLDKKTGRGQIKQNRKKPSLD